MTFTVHGQAVSRGIAIGRAVLVASSRMDVAHYFVTDEQVHDELRRLRTARDAVVAEITRVQHGLQETTGLEAHHELNALLFSKFPDTYKVSLESVVVQLRH
jgi:phosphotransferase system enzyme I (PtsI)